MGCLTGLSFDALEAGSRLELCWLLARGQLWPWDMRVEVKYFANRSLNQQKMPLPMNIKSSLQRLCAAHSKPSIQMLICNRSNRNMP